MRPSKARNKLLVDGLVTPDQWQLITGDQAQELSTAAIIPVGKVILPCTLWNRFQRDLAPRQAEIGVWLDCHESVELIADSAARLPLIAIYFPTFMDGRGFSTARLLRERYGFTGELRAVGSFIRDQLTFLRRCGVNAFVFEGGESLEEIGDSLNDFTETYQVATDQDLPIFRRRALP